VTPPAPKPVAAAPKPLAPVPPAAAERAWSTPSGTTTSLPPAQPGVPITKTHVAAAAGALGFVLVLRRRRRRRKG
jgi:MYXO-CTERM domain-containing protein